MKIDKNTIITCVVITIGFLLGFGLFAFFEYQEELTRTNRNNWLQTHLPNTPYRMECGMSDRCKVFYTEKDEEKMIDFSCDMYGCWIHHSR